MSDTAQTPSQENQTIAAGPTKRRLDPGFASNLKLIGGALVLLTLVVCVAIFFFRSGGGSQKSNASAVSMGVGNSQEATSVTPAMEQMLKDKQIEDAAAAAAKNKSYIPPDSVGQALPVVAPVFAGGPGSSSYAQAAVAVGATVSTERDSHLRDGFNRQFAAYLNNTEPNATVRQHIEFKDTKQSAQGAAGSASSTQTTQQANAGAQQPAAGGTQIIAGLEIAAAELASDVRVPVGSQVYASARITSGPASGAFLIGTARVVDEGLEIAFNQMRLGTKLYKVDAIVLDQKTASNAIAGDVDRRVLQRFVLPVFMAGVQGFFSAQAQTGSTAVGLGTTSGIATPAPSEDQAKAAGIAEATKIAARVVDKSAQQPIVVSAPTRTPVGILFRAPVTE